MLSVSVIILDIFDVQFFHDLELRLFKVIQGQRSWCQSKVHGRLLIRLLLTPTSIKQTTQKRFFKLGKFSKIKKNKIKLHIVL